MSLERVIAVAEGEVGTTEYPSGSNRVKYWDIFGLEWQGQPWCVAFLAWVFRNAEEGVAFLGGGKTASCGIMLRWYREMDQTVSKSEVQRGDIVVLNFSGTLDTQHCGLVTDVSRSNGSILYIRTIEGNTSDGGSQDNGGMVCRKVRYPRQIVGVCRPKYKQEVKPVDDITGHWSEKYDRWAKENNIMSGYPDGSFQPDKPVTRGETAAVVYRHHAMIEEELSELRKEMVRLKELVK